MCSVTLLMCVTQHSSQVGKKPAMQNAKAKSPNRKINAIGCHEGNIPDTRLLLLRQWFSNRVTLAPRGHLAIHEDTVYCPNWGMLLASGV